MKSKNDFLDYLEHSELYHYGVLGMHWGVRKAERYATDTHQHMYNQEVKKSKADYKAGKITKEQHKKNKVAARLRQGSRNDYVRENLRKTPKRQKGVSAKSIVKPYKDRADKIVNNYGTKRGLRGAYTALSGYGFVTNLAAIPVLAVMGTPPVTLGAAVLGTTISTLARESLGTYVSRKTM